MLLRSMLLTSASLVLAAQAPAPQAPAAPASQAAPAAETPATSAAPPLPVPTSTSARNVDDRRSQELFAAYVSAKPIPCPKCKTPLRHRALSEYVCPSCGQTVRFPKATEPRAPPIAAPPA